MPSFTDLSSDDRWALVHYVSSLGSTPEVDSLEDLKKVGFDPSLGDYGVAGGEVKVQRKIPIDFALERYLNESR